MEIKEEENRMNPLEGLICQINLESQTSTIHTLVPKGRLSLGFSSHQSRSGRKVINLKEAIKQ